MASRAGVPGALEITVERVEGGEVSPFLLDEFRIGDTIELRGPIGGYCGKAGPLAELQLYGGETGIVLRCRRCEAVNIRPLETDRTINLDPSGVSRFTIGRS